jgi:CRISPR-associated endonuclease/helicase Cas3
VVDRRAVVDQATSVAVKLRECVKNTPDLKAALGLERELPISTLRGKFIDDREWLDDPSSPAVVVGTVDMIGSRLLFEGYGVSRKMRPYHAGLLGADTLLVLDEAHLVPPFERLLETIARGRSVYGPRDSTWGHVIPPFRLMSLSATGRQPQEETFGLTPDDKMPGTIPKRRLDSIKRVTVVNVAEDEDIASALARHAWALSQAAPSPIRCLIFSNLRETADRARGEVERLAQRDKRFGIPEVGIETELFVGGRRVFERENAAIRLEQLGFIAGAKGERTKSAFLFATSAGEVGVDLDADHLVCDVVEWERMVQRLGRVNRRGEGEAEVRVLWASPDKKRDPDGTQTKRLEGVLELLSRLPTYDDGTGNASPGALGRLKEDPETAALISQASTPPPLHPALQRPLVESWSMTSIEEHTGRPEVAPWIRGWVDPEEPKTTVIWREILPVDSEGALLQKDHCDAFFDAAKPHLVEQLEMDHSTVAQWLQSRLHAVQKRVSERTTPSEQSALSEGESTTETSLTDPADASRLSSVGRGESLAVVRQPNGHCFAMGAYFKKDDKRSQLEDALAGATLLVDVRLGGLAVADSNEIVGLLDDASEFASDVTVVQPQDHPLAPFRVRKVQADDNGSALVNDDWREELRIPVRKSESGDELEWIVIESWSSTSAETEEGRAVSPRREQRLDEHQMWTELQATRIAARLHLPPELARVFTTAARLHDEGKRAARWQRAFGKSETGEPFAKTKKQPNIQLLNGYRHEFGSLPFAEANPEVMALSPDQRDLCLHMIAAHHGRARPLIPTDGADAPPSVVKKRAQEVALRFSRLELQWGVWGLAWWEALLRAADQRASRANDETRVIDG